MERTTPDYNIRFKLNQLRKITEKDRFWQGTTLTLFATLIATQTFDISITPKSWLSKSISTVKTGTTIQQNEPTLTSPDTTLLSSAVLPAEGVTLPISWGDLGKRMIVDGVIDEQKFRPLFENGLSAEEEQLLSGNSDQPIVLNLQNSRYLLDLLWAFGLSNKNEILDTGEMTDPQYGGTGGFASTGGWSLAVGAGNDHYSKHTYVTLTTEQQALVDKASRGIFRPCCGNSTHFPDCNHGMAMLGLLELMAKNGVGEQDMYRVALKVNSFWFPQTYLDLATYFEEQGTSWEHIDAKTVLGSSYSSSQGYQQTRENIKSLPKPAQGGGGCGA
ncbi:hypothetical protein CO180_02990 [candidate division WWE3 bacterium CG_4_9_14_3_um_filter_41_6]|uniref:Uncharacterized protein n=1 Tax=candidate division WWE3 bacterium CG_4_10_14_0_2_um_filter_41_14 TaxID=1975072 RepID=A0A2M7TLJ6_UNCKA|nr:MAG: hypothetical protein COY32_00815 [candidate division WWE3 bacterium CG_4_10_14_0_2_um_filter_41_14]PJA38673.1 MAG: hypothetical protein CO180_02990 [candidate division WWE3 bacterium CG_4_9_14_3_um_filter_41_6]